MQLCNKEILDQTNIISVCQSGQNDKTYSIMPLAFPSFYRSVFGYHSAFIRDISSRYHIAAKANSTMFYQFSPAKSVHHGLCKLVVAGQTLSIQATKRVTGDFFWYVQIPSNKDIFVVVHSSIWGVNGLIRYRLWESQSKNSYPYPLIYPLRLQD